VDESDARASEAWGPWGQRHGQSERSSGTCDANGARGAVGPSRVNNREWGFTDYDPPNCFFSFMDILGAKDDSQGTHVIYPAWGWIVLVHGCSHFLPYKGGPMY
jgi:hypothetical protein